MRRTAITILLAALCLCAFISCNIDATEGIYSEVASSTVNTDVNIKSYLGCYNDEHYYLSDEGIFKIGSGARLENSGSSIIRSASLNGATGEALVMTQKSDLSTVLEYYTAFGATPAQVTGTFKALLRNGLVYDNSAIYTVSGTTATPVISDAKVLYALETGDYAFFSVVKSDAIKYYVIKNDGTVVVDGVDGSSKTYIAFQPIADSGEFVIVSYNSSKATFEAFKLTSTGVESTVLFTMKSSLQYAYSTQAASFYYTNDGKEYIVIKASNYFDRYNITDKTIESISTGFATTLRTAGIVNIEATADPMVFVAGTYESMLYEIDMTNNKSTQIK
ncbi:MAG: hypothetical protein MJ057_02240 [Sphaerochaetaceae bacterium]|nr:hypothetical protein [Sphaerochaetaceae bacterium]